jgi:hypothetical protein
MEKDPQIRYQFQCLTSSDGEKGGARGFRQLKILKGEHTLVLLETEGTRRLREW